MRKKPLSLGFIGGSIQSTIGETHKIASQMDGRWCLSAGCFSPKPDENLQTALQWDIPRERIYPSWQALLSEKKEHLDAVVVLTPPPSHAEIVISALQRGYPVICEKPLATCSEEINAIKTALEKKQGYLAVTYNYTGYPMLRELQGIIQKGRLGRLHQIHIEMPQEGFLKLDQQGKKPLPQAWRLKDNKIPTLSLDLGAHVHNLIRFLSGESPIEVTSQNNNFGFFKHIVDNTMCLARYTGNLDCQLWFGKTALGHSNGLRVRVYGALGSAEWLQMNPEFITINDQMGRRHTLERASADIEIANETRYNRFKAGHPAGFIEAFANTYSDLADSLLEFKDKGSFSSPWVFGIDMAQEGICMLEAVEKSAKNKTWEKV